MTKHNCKSTCPCQQQPDVQMPSNYIDTTGKEFDHIRHFTWPDRPLGLLGAAVDPEEALANRDIKKCVDDLLNSSDN